MSKSQTLIITSKLPGLNEYVNACRSHWSKGYKMKAAVEEEIGWIILASKLKPISSPVIVTFKWYEPHWKRDADNIAFAKKFILDSLVSQRIIPNDSRKEYVLSHFDLFPDPCRDNPRIEVSITEVEGIKTPKDRTEFINQLESMVNKISSIAAA